MPESFPDPTDAELARYLSGAANPAEARLIQRWLDTALEHRRRLDDLRVVLGATEPPRQEWDPEASWSRLAGRLEPARRPEAVRTTVGQPRARRFLLTGCAPSWLARGLIAAGLGAIALAGWYLEHRSARPPAPQEAAASPSTERRTGRGERVAFRLADGTGVMLGPVSRLRYSADYGRSDRAVELEGDGYFEVAHDAARPFAVRTPRAWIRDLGTRFTLRARPEEGRVEVVVAEGRVALGRRQAPATTEGAGHDAPIHAGLTADSLVLVPGDFVRLADSGTATVRRGVNVQRYLGWTEGELVFERAPLPAVIEELERWYAVEIRLADRGLGSRILTASFRDKPITDVLDLVAASLDIRVSHSGQRFTLSDH